MSADTETLRLSVEDYHRLGEAGVLGEDSRVELLGGELYPMSPIGRRHAGAVRKLNNVLVPKLAGLCQVDCQNCFALDSASEPQPDFVLVHLGVEFTEVPDPETTYLVIEVAHSSLSFDRGIKLQAYATAGVPEVWIFNLRDEAIECYRRPEGAMFSEMRFFRRGDTISVEGLPQAIFTVEELLP